MKFNTTLEVVDAFSKPNFKDPKQIYYNICVINDDFVMSDDRIWTMSVPEEVGKKLISNLSSIRGKKYPAVVKASKYEGVLRFSVQDITLK